MPFGGGNIGVRFLLGVALVVICLGHGLVAQVGALGLGCGSYVLIVGLEVLA